MAELTTNINYLAPTSFKLVIDRRNYPNLEFFAQTIQHPGASVASTEVPIPRLSSLSLPGDKLTFGELSAIIILDEDMTSYTEMFEWLTRMVESNRQSATDDIGSAPRTESDITVSILTSHNNPNKQIKYIDCIPTMVGDINFESVVGDVQFLTFPVSFRFSYFEIK